MRNLVLAATAACLSIFRPLARTAMVAIVCLAAASAASLFAPLAAFAQDGGTVTAPWGDWAVSTIDALLPVVLLAGSSVLTYAVSFAPAWIKENADLKLQERVNLAFQKFVLAAAAQTKGVIAGKELSIDMTNEVARMAAKFAIDQAPSLVRKATGGDNEALRRMILARMAEFGLVPEDFGAEDVTA